MAPCFVAMRIILLKSNKVSSLCTAMRAERPSCLQCFLCPSLFALCMVSYRMLRFIYSDGAQVTLVMSLNQARLTRIGCFQTEEAGKLKKLAVVLHGY